MRRTGEEEGHSGRSGISLRLGLGAYIMLTVVFTAVSLGTVATLSARARMRQDLRSKLSTLAAAMSAAIDPEEHALLVTAADMQTPAYEKYRKLFAEVRAEDPKIAFLYTLRKSPDGKLTFVLDSGETEEDFSPLGSTYDELVDSLERAFIVPYKVSVETEFNTDQWGTWLSAFAPIVRKDGTLEGVLGIDMGASDIADAEWSLIRTIVGLTVLVVLAGAGAALLLSRRIVKPLLRLSEDMKRIKTLDLDNNVDADSRIIEIRAMEAALGNMKKSLRSFKRYVPSDVVVQLIGTEQEASLGTDIVELSVMFSDLENFTGVSEAVGKDLIPRVLGPYLKFFTGALQSRGATVDKFIGDAVMSFWGAPSPCPDHAVRACRAAIESRRGLEKLRDEWRSMGIEPMRTRIGINSGDAMVGNIGFEERLSYTAIGDTVNLASRLESLNKLYGTSILIGENTRKQLGDAQRCRLIDKVSVKGRLVSCEIYELIDELDLPADADVFLGAYQEALEPYFAGNFERALSSFRKVAFSHPEDGPSRVMAEKCERFIAHPPPGKWTGVTVMHDK
ncbi:MAG: hypothetical protein A2Z99_04185 [Treponema sp. GWB1_62_6]|nr:MAG: hypothetical protein A2Z99_04185 [Treponema sp. GWB1_62_6]OHE63516.1 MAG: hypothetical protein A2Y36_18200 [Treponema sp. GWA1_62_8]OHE66152.1 MAG: hypothetical protein A2001_09845 [Treponema sp. GWC1_61_84]